MSRLKPYELINGKNLNNVTFGELQAMLEHYGFTHKGSGSHIKFTHREYGDLVMLMPYSPGTMHYAYVQQARDACLEVKRRNSARKAVDYEPVPDWVLEALPPGLVVEQPNHSIHFEAGGVIDLDAPTPPLRHYDITCSNGRITVTNLDCKEHAVSFTLRKGDRHPVQALEKIIDQLDIEVRHHINASNRNFRDELQKMKDGRGFVLSADDPDMVRHPKLRMSHPVHPLSFEMDLPIEGKPVPREATQKLLEAKERHDAILFRQLELLETLADEGWNVQHQPSTEQHEGALLLTHKNGAFCEVPTCGVDAMFDVDLLRSITKTLKANPKAVTERPQATVSHCQPISAHELRFAPPFADRIVRDEGVRRVKA